MKKRSGFQIMARLIGLVKPLAGYMVLAIVMGLIGHLAATFITVFGGYAVADLLGIDTPFTLSFLFAAVIVFALVRGLLRYAEQSCNHFIAFKLLAHVRDLVFGALRRLTPAKLAGSDSGALISTVTADVELLEVFYAHTISPICIAVLMTVVMGAFLGGIHPVLAAVALASYALVGIAVPVAVSRASGGEGRRSRDLAAWLSGFVLDGLRGLGEVLQYGAGASRLEELDRRSAELVASQRRLRARGAAGQAATTGAIMVFSCAQMLMAASLAGAGLVTAEGAVLATVATFSSFGPFVALANLGSTLQGTLAAYAADRDDERDAGARHVDPHLAAERLLDLGPGVGGEDGKQNGFFALFQAEGGQHFLHGRAGTHGAEADTDTVALVQGQERVRGAAVGDGDQPVKGICHS
mgnify:CR=1 FL=1